MIVIGAGQITGVTVSGSSGATGAGTDTAFVEVDSTITKDYTLGSNAYVSGVTVLAGNIFSLAGHNFVADSYIHFSGTLPSGISADTPYYVIATNLSTSTFSIANTVGGSILTVATTAVPFSVGKIKHVVAGASMNIANGVTVTIPNGTYLTLAG